MVDEHAVHIGAPQRADRDGGDATNAVGDLPLSFACLDSSAPGHEIERLFAVDASLPGVAITGDNGLVGMIARDQFLSWMAKPYGRDLYRTRPIRRLLERGGGTPLCVSADDDVARTAGLALARADDRLYEPVVVTFADGRLGVLDMQILLRAVAGVLEEQMRRTAETLAELRRTQTHLIQSEKMASLGALVAGIAHEINTPVGIVLGTATHFGDITERFREVMTEGRMRRSDLDAYLDQAGEATRLLSLNAVRAAELIQSFKQVSVDQTSGERRTFALRHYLEEVLTSLTPRLKKMPVTVGVTCPLDLECDSYPGALSQILTNLVVNSLIHGFENSRPGTIRIAAEVDETDQVRLSYSDDGVGIAAEHVAKVFDPFYTTRRGAGGSGLGLHITYNLVVGVLGGDISLTSAPGHGVLFHIRFPRRAASSAPEPQRERHDPL